MSLSAVYRGVCNGGPCDGDILSSPETVSKWHESRHDGWGRYWWKSGEWLWRQEHNADPSVPVDDGRLAVKVLIVGECSGRMRQAFRNRGYDARSCDLKPAEDGALAPEHYQGNIWHIHPATPWMWDVDLLIAHPVCRYLANSGAKHLYEGMKKANGINPERWVKMESAACEYLSMKALPARFKAIENPIMHEHAARMIGKRADQFVQPWWFGSPFFKAIGFDLTGLPPLAPTNKLTPPKPGTAEHKEWSAVHREPPGPEREANRSRTDPNLAEACAEQWGAFIAAQVAERRYPSACPVCGGDCAAANPPVYNCPMQGAA